MEYGSKQVSKVLDMPRPIEMHAKEWTEGWALDRQFVG
jgi:hypothetical protein